MQTKLKEYFPLIRTRAEVVAEIHGSRRLTQMFEGWKPAQREEFLDFCTGVRGVKLLYDSFFKEIMNPEYTPERLEEFLSIVLGTEARILAVLPNDSTRIADEQTLLITDVVVELKDGAVVNVEVQKIGYRFPGQRSACYSSDLLLRQYKRVRGRKGDMFSYRDIHTVYTIVLFENSPSEFRAFPQNYVHCFSQKSDTGVELELLQNYYFIPLDIFRNILQNKGISNKLDAWLAFLCMDDPEMIVRLITAYPEFKAMYEQVYSLCQNVGGVMDMFSEELRIMDRNTVRLMIDEQQEYIDRQKAVISRLQEEIDTNQEEIEAKQAQLATQQAQLNTQQVTIDTQQVTIDAQQAQLDTQQAQLDTQQAQLDTQQLTIHQLEKERQLLLKQIAALEGQLG